MKLIIIIILLFTSLCFGQASIVAAGNQTETFGENITRIQTFDTIVEVSLGVPKFEVPIEKPKPVAVKKKTFLEKVIDFIKKLIDGKR